MITSDAAQGLAVLLIYLAMMLWGVFQTFWPSEPDVNLPGGGHKVRKGLSRRIARQSPKVSQASEGL
jgi:hypothetical protein